MGIPYLVAGTKAITDKYPNAFGGSTGLAVVLCVEDFLNFLAATPAVLASFKALLLSLEAFIDLQVAALELVVSQLDILTTVANALIQPYRALQAQIASELGQFNFNAFQDCPIIQQVRTQLTSQSSSIPGISEAITAYRDINGMVMQAEYEILQWQKQVAAINAQIEKLKVSKILFQAIINAIDAQYPGI